MVEENKWNNIVSNQLLEDKRFDIKEVHGIEVVKTMLFDKEIHKMIVELINKRDWQAVQLVPSKVKAEFGEYLDVVKFKDQNQSECVATIYDSDELWQDPEILEVILLV